MPSDILLVPNGVASGPIMGRTWDLPGGDSLLEESFCRSRASPLLRLAEIVPGSSAAPIDRSQADATAAVTQNRDYPFRNETTISENWRGVL